MVKQLNRHTRQGRAGLRGQQADEPPAPGEFSHILWALTLWLSHMLSCACAHGSIMPPVPLYSLSPQLRGAHCHMRWAQAIHNHGDGPIPWVLAIHTNGGKPEYIIYPTYAYAHPWKIKSSFAPSGTDTWRVTSVARASSTCGGLSS